MSEVRYFHRITDAKVGSHTVTFSGFKGPKIIESAMIRPHTHGYAHNLAFGVWVETGAQPDIEVHTEGEHGRVWQLGSPLRVSGGPYHFYVTMACVTAESEQVTFTLGVRDAYAP